MMNRGKYHIIPKGAATTRFFWSVVFMGTVCRLRTWMCVPVPLLAVFFCVLSLPAQPKPKGKSQRPRLAVLLVFDQMRGDYLSRWQKLFAKGGFRRLQEQGTWFQNCHYPYANTVTAAGHASLLTGCSPNKHGIIANDWYERGAGKVVASVASDRYQPVPPPTPEQRKKAGKKRLYGAAPVRLLMPTLGDALKKATGGKGRVISLSLKDRSAVLPAGASADACYWFDSNTGQFVTSTYYREKLHSWAADYNRSRPADAWFGRAWKRLNPRLDYQRYSGPDDAPGEWIGIRQGRTFPHPMTAGLKKPGKNYYEAVVNSPYGNDLLFGLAKKAIAAERLGQKDIPDLLCVSFSSNDLVGHCWGPDSQEVLDITLRSDRLIKELLNYLDVKVGAGRYVLAVSADHGICPLPEAARAKGKPAGRLPETLLSASANQFLNDTFAPDEQPADWIEAAVFPWVYLNRSLIKERKLDPAKVEQALAQWLARQRGIQAAYTRTRLLKGPFKKDPIGEKVRHSFFPDRSGDVAVVAKPFYLVSSYLAGTTHGSPHAYDTHVPLLIYGSGVPARIRQDAVTPQATVVILARALGIRPPRGAEAALPAGIFQHD
jgi:predicted AlkP superfamily pyrophosphatase or phosphodiesterase